MTSDFEMPLVSCNGENCENCTAEAISEDRIRELFNEGNYPECLSLIEKVSDEAYTPELFFYCGVCHKYAGNTGEADKAFRKAVELIFGPATNDSMNGLLQMCIDEDDSDIAIRVAFEYNDGVTDNPDVDYATAMSILGRKQMTDSFPVALYHLACMGFDRMLFEQASTCCEAFLDVFSKKSDVLEISVSNIDFDTFRDVCMMGISSTLLSEKQDSNLVERFMRILNGLGSDKLDSGNAGTAFNIMCDNDNGNFEASIDSDMIRTLPKEVSSFLGIKRRCARTQDSPSPLSGIFHCTSGHQEIPKSARTSSPMMFPSVFIDQSGTPFKVLLMPTNKTRD